MTTKTMPNRAANGFRHDAVFYAGMDDFAVCMTSFIRDSLAAGEPILVVVQPEKIDLLRSRLDGDAGRVLFQDMAEIGRNPSRIIPVWRDYVAQRGGHTRVRGIGEPIWAERTAEELVESQRHESLLNLAFAGESAWIACPYDTEALDPAVIEEAFRSHPFVVSGGATLESPAYPGVVGIPTLFDEPLAEPQGPVDRMIVDLTELGDVRRFVRRQAVVFGLSAQRSADLVLAVNEVAGNTVRHSGGLGTLRVWSEGDSIVCEVRDGGLIDDPLVGRARPGQAQEGGIGLWLVNQLCDLVQVRTSDRGSVVRLHMSRG